MVLPVARRAQAVMVDKPPSLTGVELRRGCRATRGKPLGISPCNLIGIHEVKSNAIASPPTMGIEARGAIDLAINDE